MTSFDPMSQRRIPWVSAFSFVFILNFAGAIFAQSTSERFEPELFAFQTGFANADSKAPKDLVRLVDESGFDGVELMGLDQLHEFLPHLRSRGLKLHSLYLKLDLDQPDRPLDPRWNDMLNRHGSEMHAVWFHIHSQKYGRSDPAGDSERRVPRTRQEEGEGGRRDARAREGGVEGDAAAQVLRELRVDLLPPHRKEADAV